MTLGAEIGIDQIAPTVVVAVLGYGARPPSVDALARIAIDPNIVRLMIFWNSPTAAVRESLVEFKVAFPGTAIQTCEDNLGSAGGYARLLETFRKSESAPFLLLLDDDLKLDSNCIKQLLIAAASDLNALEQTLLLAYRPGLPELEGLVSSNVAIRRPRPGCCVGFHFLNLFKPEIEPIRRDSQTGHYSIGSAPWGGLLIPREALARLGSPREDFFLYAEDYELTSRFVWAGGEIELIPDALIHDGDVAWNAVGGAASPLKRRILHLPDIKVFHEVRNRNFMARNYYPGSYPIYLINKTIFLGCAYALGLWYGRLSRARLIRRAINDGELMASTGLPHDYSWH